MKHLSAILLLLVIFQGCESPNEKQLHISVNSWIGFSPLIYAMEKGWLESLNIKLHPVVSLSENVHIFQSGKSQAFPGTQFEYHLVQESTPDLIPIIAFDRSYGGDLVMSNVSIKELQNTKEKIDTYLEMDTINYDLLIDFLKAYDIPKSKINFIDINQVEIASQFTTVPNRPSLAITYIPYNIELNKKGLKTIASTRQGLNLLVIDALYISKEIFAVNKTRMVKLKKLIDKAILNLEHDSKEYFEKVAPYLDGISYPAFLDALKDIKWLNKGISSELKNRLKDAEFPTENLI